jgi:hypothetical protein
MTGLPVLPHEACVPVLLQLTPAAGAKRSRPPEPQPQPLPTRALPMAVWEDHLLSRLRRKDAARLACTCKALRVVVRECFKDVGGVRMRQLKTALTTFPRARAVEVTNTPGWGGIKGAALVQWLHEQGHGRCLERVAMRTFPYTHRDDLLHQALRESALPSLKNLYMDLEYNHQALFAEGLVAGMHELCLVFECAGDDAKMGRQLAALGLVRELPALAKLEVGVRHGANGPVHWPPFIPPSLRALRIKLASETRFATESLLGALPGMLEARGARLERLEIVFPQQFQAMGDGLVHLAQTLRCCSPTLKGLYLSPCQGQAFDTRHGPEDRASQERRLREQWADVLASVSACRELQVLILHGCNLSPPNAPRDV